MCENTKSDDYGWGRQSRGMKSFCNFMFEGGKEKGYWKIWGEPGESQCIGDKLPGWGA